MELIFAKSRPGIMGITLPEKDVPVEGRIDKRYLREKCAELPSVSEPEVVRHFTNLSKMNFSVDSNFNPLGSCTMTYNPKITEKIAALEACTGKPIVGFSGGRKFNRGNEHTYAVLEAIGAKYMHTSARYETLPCYAFEPYQVPGHSFVRAPMQSRCLLNVGVDEFDQECLAMSGSN